MAKSLKVNKTLRLDPALLNQAKRILGYSTYTKAIEETLKIAIQNKKHSRFLKKYQGKLKGFRSLYE